MLDDMFELKAMACLYRSTEFCAVGAQHLKPKYFSNALRNNMAKAAIDFYKQYKTTISQLGFVDAVKSLLDKKVILSEEKDLYIQEYRKIYAQDINDWKYVLEKLITFVKQQEIKILIEDAVTKHLPAEDFDNIEKGLRNVLNISSDIDVEPTAYIGTIDDRYKRREEDKKLRVNGIPTGIDKLDEIMGYRGWMNGELYCVGGSAKAGKSQALAYFANTASVLGHNVAYFTLEVSTDVINDRIDAMNSSTLVDELGMRNKEVVEKLKLKAYKGEIFVFDYPTKRCTTDEIERQLRKMEIERGVKIDMLVVDYLGIMKPNIRGEKWDQIEDLAENLRAIAKVFNMPVLTAAQLNRGGSGKKITSGSDLAGAYSLTGVVDGLLTICGSQEAKDRGEIVLRTSEFRNCAPSMLRIKTDYAKGQFYSAFLGEEF